MKRPTRLAALALPLLLPPPRHRPCQHPHPGAADRLLVLDLSGGSRVVIGHAPRHLDRNIAVVGRVLAGIEALAALPRGTEALDFYSGRRARPAIMRARIAADMPAAERPSFDMMRTDVPDFAAWVSARQSRG